MTGHVRTRCTYHDASIHERRGLAREVEALRGVVGVLGDEDLAGALLAGRLHREGAGHDAVLEARLDRPVGVSLGKDVDALAALGESVLGAVDDAPLDRVTALGEAGEDDREVAAALGGGTLEQAVDVLEETIARRVLAPIVLELEEAVDVPPKDALLALDTVRLGERASDGVVLAGESTDDHIDGGDIYFSALCLVEDLVDVLVYDGVLAEVRLVAADGELASLRSGRLPLVGPDGLEGARRREVELGIDRHSSNPRGPGESRRHPRRARPP